MNHYSYAGDELDLFCKAKNWKAYWASQVAAFLRGAVLEVGAGVGANTRLLLNERIKTWLCLEPDPHLLRELRSNLPEVALPDARIEVLNGTLRDCGDSLQFDSILYIDVLEHIKDDARELALAGSRLKENGFLIVLSPAHQWLFSEFDARIGHFRRYTKASLKSVAPRELKLRRLRYLDSCGLAASLANRVVLHQGLPTRDQIQLWDGRLVPASRMMDRLTGYLFGKSVLAVWQRA
jgi:SAM-dependent methyltransferase